MARKKAVKKISKAIILLESQPPHLGEAFAVMNLLNTFDFVCICVSSKETVMSTKHSIMLWEQFLQNYKDKIFVCTMTEDFETTTNLPKHFDGYTYFTLSQKVYVNLATAHYPIELLPSVVGYETTWEAMAFRKARSYHYIKTRSYLKNIDMNE